MAATMCFVAASACLIAASACFIAASAIRRVSATIFLVSLNSSENIRINSLSIIIEDKKFNLQTEIQLFARCSKNLFPSRELKLGYLLLVLVTSTNHHFPGCIGF